MKPDNGEVFAQSKKSRYFVLNYNMRQAPDRHCSGTSGVRHLNLILCYIQALDGLYSALKDPPFDWKKPPPPRVRVDLRDSACPWAFPPIAGREAYIELPCRYEEPNLQTVRQLAAVNATHEAAHLFTFAARPPASDKERHLWTWMHEATAVFLEGYMCHGNPEANRFALEWVDQPHMSLNAPAPSPWRHSQPYHSGWFLKYLARREGPRVVGELWNDPRSGESPFEALHRLRRGLDVLDSTGESSPFFTEYCFDSYYLNDNNLDSFAPDLYARYRARALRAWATLGPAAPYQADDAVSNLACHYYRIDPAAGVKRIEARLTHGREAGLRMAVERVTRDLARGAQRIAPPGSPRAGDTEAATASLQGPFTTDTDHVVICVANPKLASHEAWYRLEVQAS